MAAAITTTTTEEMLKTGNMIRTFSGKMINPLNPDSSQINLKDIAHALSNICRFTGHVRRFYSVAQHCVLVSSNCYLDNALAGLLHDASEAYLCDIASPVKHQPEFTSYRIAETRLQNMIYKKYLNFEGSVFIEPVEVKQMDWGVFLVERQHLFNVEPMEIPAKLEYTNKIFVALTPKEAEKAFINEFKSILRRLAMKYPEYVFSLSAEDLSFLSQFV